MPLLEELPTTVETTLREQRNGQGEEPLTLSVKADIAPNGSVGERWVVVDQEMVRVFTPNGADRAHLDLALPLAEIDSAYVENLVGSGALLVGRNGSDAIEIARFTAPLAGRMSAVARTIDALAKNEEVPDASLEEDERKCPKCGRPYRHDSKVCRNCLDKRAVLMRLFSYAAPYRVQAILLVALMFAGTAMSLAPGVILKSITDQVLAPSPEVAAARGIDGRLSLLGWLAGALIATQAFNALLTIFRGRLSAWLSGMITYRIRTQVHDRLHELGLSYFDKRHSGQLLARVTQDVNELNNFLVDGLQILVVNGLTIVGIIAVLLIYNPVLTLLVLVPVPIVVFVTRKTWRFLHRKLHRMWHLRSALTASLNSVLSGVRVVKAFAQEQREVDRFHQRARSLLEAGLTVERSWAVVFPLLNLLMTSGSFIVWYVGGRQVVGDVITLGTLQMFLFFLGQLYGPLQQMTRIADWLSRAMTSAERVFEVADAEPDVANAPDAVRMPRIEGRIEFENVSFGYDKARRVVENLNLVIEPGEMIGLAGHSGAGKTTIINLISRFYDPTEGRILVDGVDMRQINLNDLRRQLGVVLQEPFLFPGSITENIAYGKPEASPEEVMRAAKAANAHDFIMRFPDGYDTQVGERGAKLSGGERQRLSIARAILHDPRILILDEATASVDTETEKQIQEAISRLIKGRTTFAIAHRLSTLRNADRLIVMERGKIAELGTHQELMEKPEGTFRRLVEMQTEINKLRAY